MKGYLKFKFNGGHGAVLCSNCSVIIMQGSHIPKDIWDAVNNEKLKDIPPMFCCKECEEEYNKKKDEEL